MAVGPAPAAAAVTHGHPAAESLSPPPPATPARGPGAKLIRPQPGDPGPLLTLAALTPSLGLRGRSCGGGPGARTPESSP